MTNRLSTSNNTRLRAAPFKCMQHMLPGAIATSLLLAAGWAQAVDLGGATVDSKQGERLQARIEVLDLDPQQIQNLTIKPASPGSYARAGLRYQTGLAVLNVVVRSRANGSAYVDITTRDVMVGRSVDLLLDVRWASGTAQREFALELAPSPISNATGKSQPPTTRLSVISVQRNDTASAIINRSFASFGSGVSANQALIALQQQNPEAFILNNVNLVKAGAALTLPTAQQVQAVEAATANRLMAEQRTAFGAYKQRLAADTLQATAKQDPTVGKVQKEKAPTIVAGDRLELKASADTAKALEALAEQQANEAAKQREQAAQQRINELQALQKELAPPAQQAEPNLPAGDASASATATVQGRLLKEVPATVSIDSPVATSPPQPAGAGMTAQLTAWAERLQSHPFWQHPQVKHPLFWPIALGLLALLAWLFAPRPRSTVATHAPDPDDAASHDDTAAPTPNYAYDAHDVNAVASADHSSDENPLGKAYALWRDGFQDLAVHTLNQALAFEPDRPDLYMALLGFHRDRGAQLAYEATARELSGLVDADSPEWAQCCDWGQDLDPDNELYRYAIPVNLNAMTDLRASDLDLKDKT